MQVSERFRLAAVRGARSILWKAYHANAIVSIGTVSAAPCGLAQGHKAPELDKPVEISKTYVDWQEYDIAGVSDEVTPELDRLAEDERPDRQKAK